MHLGKNRVKSDKSGVYSDDRRHAMRDRRVGYSQGSGGTLCRGGVQPGRSGQQSGCSWGRVCAVGEEWGPVKKEWGTCLLSNCTWDQHLGGKDLCSSQGQRSTGLHLGVHEAPMAVLETSCGSFRGNDVNVCGWYTSVAGGCGAVGGRECSVG